MQTINGAKEIICNFCGKIYSLEHLTSIELFGMLCPTCRKGTCSVEHVKIEVPIISEEIEILEFDFKLLNSLKISSPQYASMLAQELDCYYQKVASKVSTLISRGLIEKRKEKIDHLEETPHSSLPYSDFGDSIISDKQQMKKKVFVSGCYDLLHSGHVEFFQQASRYGDLYVGIGSDATYLEYKHRKPMFPQEERLFMVKNIKAVKDAYINEGSGVIDFLPTLDKVKPDVFVVNAEGGSDEKRRICKERGIEYVELQRTPHAGLKARSSSDLKKALLNVSENAAQEAGIPTRLDLAGTWIDQPYVSMYHPGWAITISLEPTFEVRDRCGLSTSTRKMIQKIWPVKLPKMDPEMLARLVFCFENNPERHDGIISGAQDSIGICVPGLVRHYYDNNFWPEKIESTQDEMTLRFLEDHLVMIPMEPRRPGCSVVEGKDITPEKVKALADAADACWKAILAHDLDAFAAAYRASFEAQIAMFPGMVNPSINGVIEPEASVQPMIDRYSNMEEVLAWKMPGAGGGGYLALVVKDSLKFAENHDEAIHLQIRRA